jgi:hypothetical protein
MLTYIAVIRMVAEGSTLFINLRWIFTYFDLKDTIYYKYNGVLVMISFGLCRIVTIPFIELSFYNFTQSSEWENLEFIYKFISVGGSVVFDSLNTYWYYKIVMMVLRYFKRDAAVAADKAVVVTTNKPLKATE